jgi:hypothetical protein
MTRGRAARFIGVALAATLMTGCARSAPNRDGWWDPGVHEVDGYWVTEERPCPPAPACAAARDAALATLRSEDPAAVATRVVTAGVPVQRGQGPDEISFAFGGMGQPGFVILDLADGSRRAFGLQCGPDFSASDYPATTICQTAEFERWRVTGS